MSYNKRIGWKDHVVTRPRTYTEVLNGDGSKTLTPAPGEVLQQGTPISATNLNAMDAALQHISIAYDMFITIKQAEMRAAQKRIEELEAAVAALTRVVTTNGLLLTEGVHFGDSLPGTVTPGKLFFIRAGGSNSDNGGGSEIERYTGDYQVTPTASGKTLETNQKLMTDDVTIQAIPFSSVGNNSGGKTIYIGGANEINKT